MKSIELKSGTKVMIDESIIKTREYLNGFIRINISNNK